MERIKPYDREAVVGFLAHAILVLTTPGKYAEDLACWKVAEAFKALDPGVLSREVREALIEALKPHP